MVDISYEQANVSRLLEEYRKAAIDARLKKCVCKGILHDVAEEMRCYYSKWLNNDARYSFHPLLHYDTQVKIVSFGVKEEYDSISLRFRLAANPHHICSGVRWTKKELECLREIRERWDNKISKGLGFHDNDYWLKCINLGLLKNRIRLIKEVRVIFDERDIMEGVALCRDTLIFENTGEAIIILKDFKNNG